MSAIVRPLRLEKAQVWQLAFLGSARASRVRCGALAATWDKRARSPVREPRVLLGIGVSAPLEDRGKLTDSSVILVFKARSDNR